MVLEGEILSGRYRLVSVIGRGGMGEVWSGVHTGTGRKVAIKILDSKFLENPAIVERFGREARAASAIEHPGIADVLDVDRTPAGLPFLVMEFLQGETLGQRIEALGRLSEAKAVDVVAQLLEALHAAHERGIVHRDLKPDNIFLVPKGPGKEVVKILDFGISQKADEVGGMKLTQAGAVLGTPHYMSPEQAIGQDVLDGRADIYAVGVVLYECLVGDVPFDADNYNALLQTIVRDEPIKPTKRGAAVSPAVERVILLAMQKKRDDRPQTAAQMRSMLLAAAQQGVMPTVPARTTPQDAKPAAPAPPAPPISSATWSDPSELKPLPKAPSAQAAATPTASPALSTRAAEEPPTPQRGPYGGDDPLEDLSLGVGLEIDERALRKHGTPPRMGGTPPDVSSGTGRFAVATVSATGAHTAQKSATATGSHATMPRRSVEATRNSANESSRMKAAQSSGSPRAASFAVIGVLVVAAGAAGAYWMSQDRDAPSTLTDLSTSLVQGENPPPVDPAQPSAPPHVAAVENVNVDITGIPNTATTRLNGLPVGAMPMRLRKGEAYTIVITAPGFETKTLLLNPQRDTRIQADMRRVPLKGQH